MCHTLRVILIFMFVSFLFSCAESKKEPVVTPWGEVQTDTILPDDNFTVSDIVSNGELIALTLTGPETYYDYRGRGMGAQYLLCEKFAQKLGVSLRIEVCKDTMEMVKRLQEGDADVIAFPLPKKISQKNKLIACGAGVDSLGVQWAVDTGNKELADSLNNWFKPNMLADIKKEENYLLSSNSVKRHVYAPFLNRAGGRDFAL